MASVLVERDDGVAIVMLNRPEALNALSRDMYAQLNGAIRALDGDDQTKAIVITGTGGVFCAGADLKAVSAVRNSPERERLSEIFDLYFQRPLAIGKPMIAAIDGYCVGEGFAIAQACDIRLCTPGAKFLLPEVKMGIPAVTLAVLSHRTLHANYALELLLTGEQRDAAWALRSGFINQVVEADQLATAARMMAHTIAKHSTATMSVMRRLVYRSFERDYESMSQEGFAQRRKLLEEPLD